MLFSSEAKILMSSFFCLFLICQSTLVKAQDPLPKQQQPLPKEYSDDQLKKFAEATLDVQKVQMKYQQKIMTVLKEEELDPQKFSEIAQSQQNPNNTGDIIYSDEEMEAYNNVMKEMEAQQEDMNQEMQEALKKNDMTMEQYQEMALTIQQAPEMQEKVRTMMQEQQ